MSGNDLVKVELTLDRNGRVTTISPDAAVISRGGSVKYKLKEPTSETNWRFIGVQFRESARSFDSVEISASGRVLTLRESVLNARSVIECTLLYTLDDAYYYPAGRIGDREPVPLSALPVHAYDPMIVSQN